MILLLLVALALASCQRDTAPPAGPHLVFAETAHDAGSVEVGAQVKHVFPFRNEGGRALRLASLRTSCGCRAVTAPGDAVAPGEAAAIELTCDGEAGPARRTVTVYSNDAAHPAVTLELRLTPDAAVSASPARFYFGRARRGERTRRDIRLKVRDAAVEPKRVSSENGQVSANLEHRGNDWRVAVTVAAQAPVGVLRDNVVIETAGAAPARLVVPVLGTVEGDVEAGR